MGEGPRGAWSWAEVDPPGAAAGDSPPPPWIPAVVAAGVALAFWWLGRPEAAVLLVVVVAALLVASWRFPAVGRLVARAGAVLGRGAGRLLTVVLLGGLALIVVVPVWGLGRLVGWDLLAPGDGAVGRWQSHAVRAWQSLPVRPFAREQGLSWSRRVHAASVLGLAVVLVLALTVGDLPDRIRGRLGSSSDPEAPTAADAAPTGGEWEVLGSGQTVNGDPLMVEGAAWAPEALVMSDEHQVGAPVYDANLTVRTRDAATPYFNVHDRVRRTSLPADVEPALDVWFFGSSALFGPLIIRDEHTIPSEVVRLAEADDVSLRVSNFGVPGYESWQQALLLAQMLTERPDPDLVVFYGGFNDLQHYVQYNAPTQVTSTFADDMARVLQSSDASGITAEDDDEPIPITGVHSPENAATIYDRAIELTENLLEPRGIAFHNVLQPSIWTRDHPDDAPVLDHIGVDPIYHETFGAVYNAARAMITAEVVDLSDVLDEGPGVAYWDIVHHNEAANRVIAEALYASLQPGLEDLSAAAESA